MKNPFKLGRWFLLALLVSPLCLAWLPLGFIQAGLPAGLPSGYLSSLLASFRQLSLTLAASLSLATLLTLSLGYLSVLRQGLGRSISNLMHAVESVPAILIALFCYAPMAAFLAGQKSLASSLTSLGVFVMAATLTALPESVRALAIPLGEMYHRKYSVSFRSYGFTKGRILKVLMATTSIRAAIKRAAAGILLKTLVLDCSFGFIIQLGFGSYGTPAHASPGALIAANRDALFQGGSPLLFWLPSILLSLLSLAFLFMLDEDNDKESQE